MAEKSNPIYEEKWEKSVSLQNGKSTKSIMRYLKPCGETCFIKTPLLSDDFSQKNPLQWPIKVNFAGWRKPTSDWSNWLEKLSIKYAKIWEQTGISDAILSSLYEIKPNPETVLGLCEFWCPDTNTFVFPWGEATITLEDVMILAGLPVLGEPVNVPLLEDSMKILEKKLNRVRSDLSKCINTKRASYSTWIKYFNGGRDEVESLEHVGFLAYWLSRFVFPELNKRTLGKHVFPTAIQLSCGVKTAIAPAVLACLYQNLTFLAHSAADCSYKKQVTVPGPLWIVQIWALERFPLLGSKLAKPLSLGQPRAARWDKLVLKNSLVDVRSTLRSGHGFRWRPYALDLKNWCHRSFYPENELMVSDCSALDDEELKSFWACLQPQQLAGIDFAEQYRPQRVAMQLGYDQDLPGEFATYSSIDSERGSMFVPSRFSQPGVSRRYWKWWKKSMGNHIVTASKGLEQEGIDYMKSTVTNDLVKSDVNCESECISKGLDQLRGSDINQLTLEDDVKSSLKCDHECLSKGLEEDSDHKKPTRSNELFKSASNCESKRLLQVLEPGVNDREMPILINDLKNSSLKSEVDSLSKEQKQHSHYKKPTPIDGLEKSDLSCAGEHRPNTAETSTPTNDILNAQQNGSGQRRKFCAAKEDWRSNSIVFVDLDQEEVEKSGDKDGDQSSSSSKKVKRRVGGSADTSVYISDQCRPLSRKARKVGISSQNPIDVENY